MQLRVPLLPRWIRWVAVVGLAVFIFYTSVVTVPPGTPIDQRPDILPLDKWRHFVAYGTLGYALAYATADWDWDPRNLALLVIGITIIYGVGIEFGQSLTPERFFSIEDAYANALGGLVVVPWYSMRSRLDFVPLTEFIRTVSDLSR